MKQADGNNASRSQTALLSSLAAIAVAIFLIRFSHGLSLGWARGASKDLVERWVEYGYALNGIYPDPKIAGIRALADMRTSVYPPYAFPLLWLFFGIGGLTQGKLMVALTTAAAVVVMSRFCYRQLKHISPAAAPLGAVLPLLMTSIIGVLEWGQFGYFCTGMVVLQYTALEQNRKYLAGFAWALAMLKPQIGLSFVVLFSLRSQWRGLLVGAALLTGLSLATAAYTNVSIETLIKHWLTGQDLSFSFGNISGIPVNVGKVIPGFTPDLAAKIAMAAAGAALYLLIRYNQHTTSRMSFLGLSGLCAVVGRLAFYHRPHDDIMLLPALLAALAIALERQRQQDWLIVLATLFTLVQPAAWMFSVPG